MKSLHHISAYSRSAGLALVLAVATPGLFAHDPVDSAAKAGDKAADQTADKINDYRADNSELNKATRSRPRSPRSTPS